MRSEASKHNLDDHVKKNTDNNIVLYIHTATGINVQLKSFELIEKWQHGHTCIWPDTLHGNIPIHKYNT